MVRCGKHNEVGGWVGMLSRWVGEYYKQVGG